MNYLIINGDDLGASPGVNQGIAQAHTSGALTSTSMMVNMPWSEQAAETVRDLPALSVGLHINLTDSSGRALVDLGSGEGCLETLQGQLHAFHELMGRPPTHLDSHHNVHRNARLLPYFLELAGRSRLPLREHSRVRYVSSFYGQWDGQTQLGQISVSGLMRVLETEVTDGVSELGCHPGYCDPELRSSYRMEREVELRSLCDPAVRRFLAARRIQLINFGEAMGRLAGVARVGPT